MLSFSTHATPTAVSGGVHINKKKKKKPTIKSLKELYNTEKLHLPYVLAATFSLLTRETQM